MLRGSMIPYHFAGYGVVAVEPGLFGLVPIPAVRKVLEKAR